MNYTAHLLAGEAETAVKVILRLRSSGLLSSRVSAYLMGKVASLALVDNHSSDGVTVKCLMRQIID